MNKFMIVSLCLFFVSALKAQQLPMFTQYRDNATIINPAAMESDFLANAQNFSFGASIRSQWRDIPGAPVTRVLRGSYINTEFSGATIMAGGHILSDVTGPLSTTGIYGRFGTVISNDPEYSGIALALSGGLVQFKVDANEIRVNDPDDLVSQQSRVQLQPDLGVGVYAYQTVGDGNMLYGGISVPQIMGLDLTYTDSEGEFSIKRIQHFYAQVGLYKFLRDGESFVEPSLWVKYVEGAPINADFNLRVQLPGSIWIGAGISTANNFHLDTGFNLGQNVGFDHLFRVGYGFDYSYSGFGPFVGATHEINVTYSFEN